MIRSRHRIVAILLAMAALVPQVARAQELTARKAFENLSLNVLSLLDKSTRLDMLDYYDNDSIYQAPNNMDGLSELVKVTPDYLEVKLTDVSTLQIKILPTKKGSVCLTAYTIADDGTAGDTNLRFYDANLAELPSKQFFAEPALKDFFKIPKGSVTTMKEIYQMVSFPTVVYTLSPDNNDMKASLTVGEYMDRDDYNIVKLFLAPSITYVWNGNKFQLQKN